MPTDANGIAFSRTPRQDYFLNFQFHVPAKLKAGRYTLKVTVTDVTPQSSGSKKAASDNESWKSLDFRVCPPGPDRDKQ